MRILSVLLVALWPAWALAQDEAPRIIVTATGSASAVPDMATVSLGVEREAVTASQAMDEVAAAANAVMEKIQAAGIETRDVQTSSLNLNPVWDQGNGRPRIRGYSASTMLTVRVRDLDMLGGLLDSVVSEGANTLNGLSFGFGDAAPLETAARSDAVAKARQKAETLATAAGVTLGPVQTISEGDIGGGPVPMFRTMAMEAAPMPVAEGELDVRVSVTVVFAIGG